MNNFSLSLRAWKSVQCGQVFIAGKASELWFCTRCVSVYQEFKSLENRLDVRRHLTEQSGQKPVKLCARCNRWWCSVLKFIISCNNRIECSTRQQFIFGRVRALKKEKKSTRFSRREQPFLQEIFFQGEETGNKANPPDLAPKMKRLRQGNGDKLFTKGEWLSVVQIAWYCSRLSALDMADLPNGVESVSLEDEYTIDTLTIQRQWRRDFK